MNHLSRTPSAITGWPALRREILDAMQDVMGPLPASDRSASLDPVIDEETDCGTYVRRHLTYAPEPGRRTPAYLCIPRSALSGGAPASAVLCPHPTHARDGNKVVVGLSDKQNRSYASELAERGFITLAPAYPLLADYRPDVLGLGYRSGTMMAVWDNIRGIDFLASLPFARGARSATGFRCASIGHSLGGHNSIFTAVFDPRVTVIVSSCGFDSFPDYAFHKPGGGWSQVRYMPRIQDYALPDIPFDFHDCLAALAPRRCFVSAPLGDSNFKWQSARACVDAARRVYALHDAEDRLHCEHPDCEHDFPDDVRARAYAFIERHLPA